MAKIYNKDGYNITGRVNECFLLLVFCVCLISAGFFLRLVYVEVNLNQTEVQPMAAITEIKVNYGKTANMGNFESMRVDYGVVRTIDPDEDPKVVMRDLSLKLQAMVNEDVKGKLKKGF